nr:MAG TPA: Serine/threonine-protein kinase pim-1 [Caudoviricetes sp.]
MCCFSSITYSFMGRSLSIIASCLDFLHSNNIIMH